MKRIIIVLGLFLILGFVTVVNAADLQAGWYANITSTAIHFPVYMGTETLVGSFQSPTPGQYGPFLVTDNQYNDNMSRYISVSSNALDAGTNFNLVLPIQYPLNSGTPMSYIDWYWATNYDSTQMRLDLWHTRSDGINEIIWSQMQGGQFSGIGEYSAPSYDGTYFFQLTIVPEPSGIVSFPIIYSTENEEVRNESFLLKML